MLQLNLCKNECEKGWNTPPFLNQKKELTFMITLEFVQRIRGFLF